MLSRKPTVIKVVQEDILDYDDKLKPPKPPAKESKMENSNGLQSPVRTTEERIGLQESNVD